MNSSGIKRGLATTAVSALAIAGLPLFASSASAQPLAAQAASATDVDLITTDSGVASVKNDGVNNTVHLVANGGTGVQQVRFQYNLNPAATDATANWVTISTVSRSAGGDFETEWAPAPALYNTTVAVRALGLGAGETPGDVTEINTNVLVSPSAESVDLAPSNGASLGVFDQPYAADAGRAAATLKLLGATSGTTSDLAADPTLSISSPSGTGAATTEDVAAEVATGDTSRSFSAPVDFTGYNFGTDTDVDQALIYAEADGDDAEAVVLYKQTVTDVSAVASKPTVIPGGTSNITVTVLDQFGKPVVGAEVVGETAPASSVKYTNSQGQAVFTGATGTAAGKTYSFYVNTTAEFDYENGVDFRRTATVKEQAQTATALTATSTDGPVFDVNEYVLGDIFVTLKDQNNAGIAGQNVNYTWTFRAFPTDATPNPAPVVTSGVTLTQTDTDGKVSIPLPADYLTKSGTYTLNYYLNQDGTPGQGAGDLAGTPLVVKGGDSTLKFTAPTAAAAGSTATFEASLTLADGSPLVGRKVQFSLAQNGDDVVVAPQASQPAGTTRISTTVAEDTTDANGKVQVAIFDPANTPERSELAATLDADTVNTTGIGNAAEDADDVSVKFVTDKVNGNPAVTVAAPAGTGKPGVASNAGTVTVTADDPATPNTVETTAAPNVLVTLTVTGDAFFTDGTYEKHAANDAAGNLTSLGKTITLITNNSGQVSYKLGIERSADFDDDGLAKVNVTASVSGATDTKPFTFDSSSPLNGGKLEVVFADSKFQDSGVLPKAPTTDNAAYDVFSFDQFGNKVGGATVSVDTDGDGVNDDTISTDFADNVEFYTGSNTAQDVTPTATWNAPANLFTAASPNDAYTNQAATVADLTANGPKVSYYVVDFGASTYTLSQQGPQSVPVGTTVIMDYTAKDQNGEPIEFLVNFFRTGPDEFGDGESKPGVATGEDGVASYVFQGAAEGTATVTAIGFQNAEAIPASQVSDTVDFAGPVDERDDVVVELTGKNNGKKADVLTVTTTPAADGALATLYKVAKDGTRTPFRFKTLDNEGKVKFRANDKNGNRKTKYVVVVDETNTTKAGESNTKSVR